jgi:hypothetical protein
VTVDGFPWDIDGHSQYFSPCSESVGNVGAIVAGSFGAVSRAEPRHKDEIWDWWDPLGDLLPVDPEVDARVDVANRQCTVALLR